MEEEVSQVDMNRGQSEHSHWLSPEEMRIGVRRRVKWGRLGGDPILEGSLGNKTVIEVHV